MIVAHELDVEIQGPSTQTRLEGECDRILRETKEMTPEGDKEEKRANRGWEGVMNR